MIKTNYLILFCALLFAASCKKETVTKNTLTLQPTNNPYEVHLMELANSVDQSDPTAPEILASAWTENGINSTTRAVFKFDLSSIPSNAVIDSASLTLYSNHNPLNGNQVDANFGTNNTMLIQQITNAWDSSARWATQPSSTTNGEIVIPSTTQSFLDLTNINVTAMVSNMIKLKVNYGFLIRLQTEVNYNSRIFCSSKYADATKHPKLVVAYHY